MVKLDKRKDFYKTKGVKNDRRQNVLQLYWDSRESRVV